MARMKRKTNIRVLENITTEWTLASIVIQFALRYFGHVARQERGNENDVMLRRMSGKKRRGRPKTIKGLSINIMIWEARERTWRNATANVARGRTRFDGTVIKTNFVDAMFI